MQLAARGGGGVRAAVPAGPRAGDKRNAPLGGRNSRANHGTDAAENPGGASWGGDVF